MVCWYPMITAELIQAAVALLIGLLGGSHEEARKAITEDEARRANAAADAVAAARVLSGT